ncbi:MAG: ion transporter [Cytophagales bacterium]|nr:ion transporter [Cytophagales bacterium]
MVAFKQKIAGYLGYGHKYEKQAKKLDFFIEMLVLLNVFAVVLESVDVVESALSQYFNVFEIFTVSIFSLEFVLRLWIADLKYPGKYKWHAYRKHLTHPGTIIDFVAILPFFIPYIIDIDLRHLRVLRLVRLLRVFKLTKYSNSLHLIVKIMSEKKQELLATLLLMFSVLVIASSLMYYFERNYQPEKFATILHAFWWGVITLTTVGYGDTYPMTGMGRVLGSMVAMMGVMIVAIPTAIISSSFVQKMEETKYKKRMSDIRGRLKEAFYKKFIPELACKVRRGQLSIDAVKMNLELAEQDIYKIAEGKNEFRFRNARIMQNGILVDKLFLEYREINTGYGTLTERNSEIVIVSPESLNKQGIGYFAYCISEKLKANYISNEFYGDEPELTEENFGDKGLELEIAYNFRNNKSYLGKADDNVPADFEDWIADLEKLKKNNNTFIVFNSFDYPNEYNSVVHFITFKSAKNGVEEHTYDDMDDVYSCVENLKDKLHAKFGRPLDVSINGNFQNILHNNIMTYLHDTLQADVIFIYIFKDYLMHENLFKMAGTLSDAIKEDIIGVG